MALRRGHLECGANCWPDAVTSSRHVHEVGPRKDKRGADLIPMHCHSVGFGKTNREREHSHPKLKKASPELPRLGNSPTDETERSLKKLRAINPLARVCIPLELRPARSCICPSPLCRKTASVARGKRLPRY